MTETLTQIVEPLRHLAVPVDTLVADPANARKHDQRNLDAIKGSLRRFGQRQPIVVQRNGMVVRAGNARLQAARELGWTHIAAVIVDEPGIEATAYAIADNRTAELAEWDDDVLGRILRQLQEEDALDGVGYTEHEVEKIVADIIGASTSTQNTDTSPQLGGLEYRVVVDCADEQDQARLIEALEKEGRTCLPLIS